MATNMQGQHEGEQLKMDILVHNICTSSSEETMRRIMQIWETHGLGRTINGAFEAVHDAALSENSEGPGALKSAIFTFLDQFPGSTEDYPYYFAVEDVVTPDETEVAREDSVSVPSSTTTLHGLHQDMTRPFRQLGAVAETSQEQTTIPIIALPRVGFKKMLLEARLFLKREEVIAYLKAFRYALPPSATSTEQGISAFENLIIKFISVKTIPLEDIKSLNARWANTIAYDLFLLLDMWRKGFERVFVGYETENSRIHRAFRLEMLRALSSSDITGPLAPSRSHM